MSEAGNAKQVKELTDAQREHIRRMRAGHEAVDQAARRARYLDAVLGVDVPSLPVATRVEVLKEVIALLTPLAEKFPE